MAEWEGAGRRRGSETKWASVVIRDQRSNKDVSIVPRGCRKPRCLLTGYSHLVTCALLRISKGRNWLALLLSSTSVKFGIKCTWNPNKKYKFSVLPSLPQLPSLFLSHLRYFLGRCLVPHGSTLTFGLCENYLFVFQVAISINNVFVYVTV